MAEVAKEYLIKIVAEGGSSVGSSNTTNPSNPGVANVPESPGLNVNKNMIKGLAGAVAVGSQAISFATSNIGTFTGSSRIQENVNMGLKMAGHATHIAISPITGVIGLGMDLAQSAIMYNYNKKWEEREVEEARLKVGYTASNRSRGGR